MSTLTHSAPYNICIVDLSATLACNHLRQIWQEHSGPVWRQTRSGPAQLILQRTDGQSVQPAEQSARGCSDWRLAVMRDERWDMRDERWVSSVVVVCADPGETLLSVLSVWVRKMKNISFSHPPIQSTVGLTDTPQTSNLKPQTSRRLT